jgi:hypothetical protein
LGLLFALVLVFSPFSILVEPALAAGNVPGVLRAWGIAWVFFNVLELIIRFKSFRKGGSSERGGRCGSCHHGAGVGLALPHVLLRFGGAVHSR